MNHINNIWTVDVIYNTIIRIISIVLYEIH